MRINVQIERLILDGLPIERHHGPLVQAAVEAELGRLLAAEGLAESLMSGGAMPSARAPGIGLASDGNPARLGEEIGAAVYGGIGK